MKYGVENNKGNLDPVRSQIDKLCWPSQCVGVVEIENEIRVAG